MTYSYNAMCFSHFSERSTTTCYDMDTSWKHEDGKKSDAKDKILYAPIYI